MFTSIFPLTALTAFFSDDQHTRSAPAPTPLSADTVARINDYIGAQMRAQHIPGLSLLIQHQGKTVLLKGYGMADIASAMPVHAGTIFRIGSVSKQFAAAAVLLLVQDGRLALDQHFAQHFPLLPPAWRAITIRQLLQHTAGLQRDFRDAFPHNHAGSTDQLLQWLGAMPMQSAPGSAYHYSNLGYHLIGLLVERVSGQPYGDFLRSRIFDPLGMSGADLLSALPRPGQTASGYDWRHGRWERSDAIRPGDDGAAEGLRMSASDLARWDLALHGDQLLTAPSRAALWTRARLNNGSSEPYGLGWVLDNMNQAPADWHNGQIGGFHAQFLRLRSKGWSVAVLTNLGDAQAERISFAVAGILDPQLQ